MFSSENTTVGSESVYVFNSTITNSPNNIEVFLTMKVNDVVKPYLKTSMEIKNWPFNSSTNRIAIFTPLILPLSNENYEIKLNNQGVITVLEKVGVINGGVTTKREVTVTNTNNALLDSIQQGVGISLEIFTQLIKIQYSFSSFTNNLSYDPNIEIRDQVTTPREGEISTETTTTTKTTSTATSPGFQLLTILFIGTTVALGLIFVRRRKY
ncbi:MAG: hypothetical protein HeimC3_32360 [Candidatus Heimdallarchaeota archaeon LC_3]|nr:MAG: hypothetical protein HeimC3_32360 [Candidatus Heimdallarchaeota archaeon LC_3]